MSLKSYGNNRKRPPAGQTSRVKFGGAGWPIGSSGATHGTLAGELKECGKRKNKNNKFLGLVLFLVGDGGD